MRTGSPWERFLLAGCCKLARSDDDNFTYGEARKINSYPRLVLHDWDVV